MGIVSTITADATFVRLTSVFKPKGTDPISSALTYGLSFAALSSVLIHVWLWHREEIKSGQRLCKRCVRDVLMFDSDE